MALTPLLFRRLRFDKKCGKSAIPDDRKCSKPTGSSKARTAATVAGGLALAGGLTALALRGRRGKVSLPGRPQLPSSGGRSLPGGPKPPSPSPSSPSPSSSSVKPPSPRLSPSTGPKPSSSTAPRPVPPHRRSVTTNLYPNWKPGDQVEVIDVPDLPNPQDWLYQDVFKIPGMHQGHAVRRTSAVEKMASIDNKQLVDTLMTSVVDSPESRKAIDLIKRHGVYMDAQALRNYPNTPNMGIARRQEMKNLADVMDKQRVMEGLFVPNRGAYAANGDIDPKRIYVAFHRKATGNTWITDKEEIARTMKAYWDIRNKHDLADYDVSIPPTAEQVFATYSNFSTMSMLQSDNRDVNAALHEAAHALDMGLSDGSRPVFKGLDGKQYDPKSPEFLTEAKRWLSYYGISDADGDQMETFAETFVLYTHTPEELRKNAPILYAWMDDSLNRFASLL